MIDLFVADDDTDTATEGEEEIRARELRKQEVRVEPPVVQTDTGTDTEVKSSNLQSSIPDILPDNYLRAKTPCSEDDSADFGSAISDNESNDEIKDNKNFTLTKSATTGELLSHKPVRNFVLPPKEKRKSFGTEFVPKFQVNEPEPLLIIKRTPSKLNLPKEIGKPKVALSTNLENAKKYFGTPTSVIKKPTEPKPILKRSETVANVPKKSLIKQVSLPNKTEEKKTEVKFNFEPLDDSNEIDSYIENLMANEEELMKPIDPTKYQTQEEREEKEDETISSSIEDLFKALKTETKAEGDPLIDKKIDEKIDDLLTWMEDLEHQSRDRKTYRSLSDAKYKNLERVLKVPKRADSVVSKLPKDNIEYFERHLAGKSVDKDEAPKSFALARSKTDIYCNKPRTSIDLDAVSNVDIKKVLMKFEKAESQEKDENKDKIVPKRSFGKRFSLSSLKQREERRHSENLEAALKDFEDFVDNMESKKEKEEKDWCVNITVSTIPNPEYLNLDCDNSKNETADLNLAGEEDNNETISQVKLEKNEKRSSDDDDNIGIDRNNKKVNVDKTDQNTNESTSSSSLNTESDDSSENEDSTESSNFKLDESQLKMTNVDFCFNQGLPSDKKDFKDSSPMYAKMEQKFSPDSKEIIVKPVVNIEDLYAKVNKSPKEKPSISQLNTYSPPVPRRNRKKSCEEQPICPPPRPQRQKSHEMSKNQFEPNNNDELLRPVVPQRKRAMTSSPLPKRKSELMQQPMSSNDDNSKSRSTTNLEVKKEVVRLRDLPRIQNASQIRTIDSKSKNKIKDKDKDCSLQ